MGILTNKRADVAENHYRTINFNNICNLPIDTISYKDSVLFLWATFLSGFIGSFGHTNDPFPTLLAGSINIFSFWYVGERKRRLYSTTYTIGM